MARRPARTLLEVAVARLGMRRATRLLTFMIAWDIARQELDHAPTLQEYMDWWRVSRATAYRELALFRECFPDEHDPTRLMDAARSAWDQRQGVRGLGSVPVAAIAA